MISPFIAGIFARNKQKNNPTFTKPRVTVNTNNKNTGPTANSSMINYSQERPKTQVNTNSYTRPSENTQQEQPNEINSYLQSINDRISRQDSRLREKSNYNIGVTQDNIDTQNAAFDVAKKSLSDQLPALEKGKENFQKNVQAGVQLQQNRAAELKDVAKEETGESQRQLAQAKRETDARRQNMFAANNTVDSYGAGGLQGTGGEQVNADSDFLREQAKLLKGRDRRLQEIDFQLQDYENKAQMNIDTELAKFDAEIREINRLLANNEVERTAALQQAYQGLQERLFMLQDDYDANVGSLEDTKFAIVQEYLKAGSDQKGISEEFILNGIPVTEKDRELFYEKMQEQQSSAGAKQSVLDTVDKLLSGDTGSITGFVRTGFVPGTRGAMAKNYYDQLKAMLSLENRQQLKGSGAISDFEARTLEKAASALGQNLSNDQFRQILQELRSGLVGGQSERSNNNDPLGLGF